MKFATLKLVPTNTMPLCVLALLFLASCNGASSKKEQASSSRLSGSEDVQSDAADIREVSAYTEQAAGESQEIGGTNLVGTDSQKSQVCAVNILLQGIWVDYSSKAKMEKGVCRVRVRPEAYVAFNFAKLGALLGPGQRAGLSLSSSNSVPLTGPGAYAVQVLEAMVSTGLVPEAFSTGRVSVNAIYEVAKQYEEGIYQSIGAAAKAVAGVVESLVGEGIKNSSASSYTPKDGSSGPEDPGTNAPATSSIPIETEQQTGTKNSPNDPNL